MDAAVDYNRAMTRAIKERAIVGPAGRVTIEHSDLPEGSIAEVIVLVDDTVKDPTPGPRGMSSFVGALKGQFADASQADAHVRELRDEWDAQ